MPVYVCRWPNVRDCSVVQARSKQAAIIKLDQCQIHFRLTDEGQLELQSFGEETESGIWEFCYPVLDGVLPDRSSRRLVAVRT